MAQLPPDSQRATWSHSPSVAAPAWPARGRLPVPMTARVKAIFATFTADAVGLGCRPLIGALGPLLCAPTRSAVGFGLERLPGRVGHVFTPRGRKRLLVLSVSVDRWVPRLHPSCSSLSVHQRMELRGGGHGRPNDYGVDGLGLNANGSLWSRHLLPRSVIRPQAN